MSKEIIKTVEGPNGRYELERRGNRYKLWLHRNDDELISFGIVNAEVLRELGAAMLVEASAAGFRIE